MLGEEEGNKMNIVLSGGGTAGHIYPALALAEELADRGHRIFYAGTPKGIEARIVAQEGIEFKAFEAAGFNRNHPLSIVRALRLILASTGKAKRWFDEIKPDRVVCFGGYVCLPVGGAAVSRSIPLVVHEQNSVMGMANKRLSARAAKVALTYEVAASAVADASKVVVTGNPVRRSIFDASRSQGRAYCGVPDDARLLVVFGGSQGARHINQAVCAAKDWLLERPDLHIRHIAGPKEAESVAQALALTPEQQQRWQVIGYEDSMGKVLAACDMVVARSGATSLAEISALGIPAILVPFPYATADHQTTNARAYVDKGAAMMVADSDVEGPDFKRALEQLVDDAQLRQRMREAAAEFKTRDAAAKLADVVIAAGS